MINAPFSRRRFIKTVAIGSTGAALGVTLTGCSLASFLHGVASGDPLEDRVVIWTRITPAQGVPVDRAVEVMWIIATDKKCKHIVGTGVETTDSSRDFTLKLDVTGLDAGQDYFYQFICHGAISPVGRTRTLPAGQVDQFKLAVLSCSNYPAGYFHVYGEVAKRNDINAVLHLGDYLYEYGANGYATEDAEALGRVPQPTHEMISLTDYRQRYAQYRSDKQLQAAHRLHPFICVWDDHEITNDTWREGAENHSDDEGDFFARKANAIQAYYEWLPIREPGDGYREKLYRVFKIGNLLDLYMLDTRVIGRDEQLNFANYFDATTGAFDGDRFQADLTNPSRTVLGLEQRDWLQQQLAGSTATWQVLGQQVLMGRMNLPAPLVTQQLSFLDYQQLIVLAQTNPEALTPQQIAVLQAPSIPYNLDAWDGYFVEREIVLETAKQLDKNLVVLAGDTHNAWSNNLTTLAGAAVGVEFATSSVTSPGFEEYFSDQDPDVLAGGVEQLIENLHYANLQHRGYMIINFFAEECRAEYRYVDTVKNKNYEMLELREKNLKTLPGFENRKIIDA